MGDNPFSPEGNPFSMEKEEGEPPQPQGVPEGVPEGPGTSVPGAAPLGTTPETTKPRQVPGGGAPGGMNPFGPPPGGAPAPAPMPGMGTPPAGGATNVPQPAMDAQAFKRAVAIRDEILAENRHLTHEQAFFLARKAVSLQVTAVPYDPHNPFDTRNPTHPLHRGLTRGHEDDNQNNMMWGQPGSGYNPQDPSWAQKARQKGYTGQNPALVGAGITAWEKWKGRGKEQSPTQPPAAPQGKHEAPTTPQGKHQAPGEPLPTSQQRGRHEPPEQRGKHERSPEGLGATTGPVVQRPDTHPGGPPTPHPTEAPVQPGVHPSVPQQKRQRKTRDDDGVPPLPKHDLSEFDKPFHASLVYGGGDA